MMQRHSIILISGALGLVFLVAFGLFTSTVDLEYSEPVEVEPIETMELNCNTEIDKDGDKVPDNLDVKGPIDWSHCNLEGLNLSNLELSGAILSNSNLYRVNFYNTNLSGANLSHSILYKANVSNTNFKYANLSYAKISGEHLGHSPAVLTGTILTGANLENAILINTILNCVDHPICIG